MKVTNLEIYVLFNLPPEAEKGEKSPYRKLIGAKWPGSISYEITKLGKILNTQLGILEEARVDIVNNMKEAGNDPNVITVLDKKAPDDVKAKAKQDNDDFRSAFLEVLSKEEDIKIEIVKIPKDKIPYIEPEVLIAFDKFLEIV